MRLLADVVKAAAVLTVRPEMKRDT
jgi:hypothetical protein